MTCSYCGTRNNDGASRCRRCQRRPEDTLSGEFALQNTGALATQPVLNAPPIEAPPPAAPNFARAVQRPLFQDKTAQKVVPIGPPRPRTAAAPPVQRRAVRRGPRVPEGQGSLDFLPPATGRPRTLGTAVESMIYCEERVASIPHRFLAAALDWSMVLIGYGLFLGIFYLLIGEVPLSRNNLLLLVAVLPVLGMAYGLLSAVAGMETPGMKWAHLRLTTFEGDRPELRERMLRFAGSCLSFCTVVGLLWSFADEDGLAWQDHISRTFPTPRRADSRIFYRR